MRDSRIWQDNGCCSRANTHTDFALEIIVLLAMYLLISWFAGADAILFAAPVFIVGWFFGWLEAKQPSR